MNAKKEEIIREIKHAKTFAEIATLAERLYQMGREEERSNNSTIKELIKYDYCPKCSHRTRYGFDHQILTMLACDSCGWHLNFTP